MQAIFVNIISNNYLQCVTVFFVLMVVGLTIFVYRACYVRTKKKVCFI